MNDYVTRGINVTSFFFFSYSAFLEYIFVFQASDKYVDKHSFEIKCIMSFVQIIVFFMNVIR